MAAGQTVVQYGTMTITNCLTQPGGFSQEPVFDESDTDMMFYRFKVKVTGYIHGIPSIVTVGVLPNDGNPYNSAAISERQVRYTVAPRQPFQMTMGCPSDAGGNVLIQNGNILLQCNPAAVVNGPQSQNQSNYTNITNIDVRNGPRCTHFDITHVAADNLYKIEAEFEICKVECDANGNAYNTSGVLNNRWSVLDDVDADMRTTRKISGVLRAAVSTINANSFRAFVVPPLQPGMRRDNMSFNVSADGLWLRYEITDIEAFFSAPDPATKWRLEHSEQGSRESGVAVYGSVRVSLQGDRNVDHKKLIQIGIACAEAKLLTQDNKTIIQEVSVTSVMGTDENGVSVMVRGRRTPKDGQVNLMLPLSLVGKPISQDDLKGVVAKYDRNFSKGANAGDTVAVQGPVSLMGAWAAYLQSPCSNDHETYKAPPSSPSQNPPQTQSTSLSGSIVSTPIPDDGTSSFINSSASTAIYTFYQMESSYITQGNRVQCPIAVAPQTSLGGSGNNNGTGNPSGPTNTQPTCAVIDLAPRVMQRHIRISSERAGQVPDFPAMQDSFTSNGITYTLLDTVDRSIVPDRTSDAKKMFKIDREYVYAMSRPLNSSDQATIGVNPWENVGAYLRAYDPGIPESSYPLS